jgi:hypothetical protein
MKLKLVLASNIRIAVKNAVDKSNRPLSRFVVYRAGADAATASSRNFTTAEHLARFLAKVLKTKMEVFNSEKEISYFIEPPRRRYFSETFSQLAALFLDSKKKIKAVSKKRRTRAKPKNGS